MFDNLFLEWYNNNMYIKKWLSENTSDLEGKWVALSGSTGGLGTALCRHLAKLHASLILLDRNMERSRALADTLRAGFPAVQIQHIRLDMEDITSVKAACEQLKTMPVDILIHNAGAYSIPRHKCDTGLDNVFQINFASPYYITKELLPYLRVRNGKVVIVGSIAHNYSKTDPDDIDFSTRQASSKIYGNAKRHLMFAAYELFKHEKQAYLAVTHPGITFTNITNHYPKLIFAIIKHPMKVIFMKPCTAALCILHGVFENCGYHEWIGPCLFDIWGKPQKRKLHTCSPTESAHIFGTAEQLYRKMKE